VGTLGEARGTVVAVRAECATTAAVDEVPMALGMMPARAEGASVSEESGVVWRLGRAEKGRGRRREVRLGEGGRGVGGRL